jgi:glutathione peroxidase-family protein
MAKAFSYMLELGTRVPGFRLPGFNGKYFSLEDFKDAPALLVIFMCNHCPYVIHVRKGMVQMIKEYQAKGVAVVGINSNDIENYPRDRPEMNRSIKNYRIDSLKISLFKLCSLKHSLNET